MLLVLTSDGLVRSSTEQVRIYASRWSAHGSARTEIVSSALTLPLSWTAQVQFNIWNCPRAKGLLYLEHRDGHSPIRAEPKCDP